MSKKLSAREVIALVSQTDIEPTDALVSEIRKEYKRNPDAFQKRSVLWKGVGLMKAKVFVVAGAACALLVMGVCLSLLLGKNKAYADYYSFDPYVKEVNTTANISLETKENMLVADEMSSNFLGKLPYSGQYKSVAATGEYTVTGRKADEFPDYYCGMYINVDGKLIVLIKENYFDENYRKCDWYKELSKMLGSEDFGCRPAKYNYTELVNGMSDLVYGSLGKAIEEAGVKVAACSSNEYTNKIMIEVKTNEEADIVKAVATSDMFIVVVVDYDLADY